MPGVRHTLVPLEVGTRVVVRHSLAGDGSPPWTDALGELVAQDEVTLTVRTRRGETTIARKAVVAAKPVPARPPSGGRARRVPSGPPSADPPP